MYILTCTEIELRDSPNGIPTLETHPSESLSSRHCFAEPSRGGRGASRAKLGPQKDGDAVGACSLGFR